MIRALAVAALAVSLVPASSFPQCTDADKSALVAFDKSWSEATTGADTATLARYLSDNFSAMGLWNTTDKPTTIANAVRNAAAARENPSGRTNSSDRYVVTCTANTATITHRTVSTPAAGSAGSVTYGRAVHFLEKHGKNWQVVASTGGTVSENQQLVYLELDWNDATRTHNAAWVEANYAPFATEVQSRTGAMDNKAQALEGLKNDKRTFELLELSDLNVRVNGDAAVVTGINHAKGKDGDGKGFDRRIRFTDTFVKQDGRWMVWATQGTDIR
jgi:ketosteroid isomerase-like protein